MRTGQAKRRKKLRPQKDRVWFRPAQGQVLTGTYVGPTSCGSFLRVKVGGQIVLALPQECGPSPDDVSS